MPLQPDLILATAQPRAVSVPELLQQSAQSYDMLQSIPLLQRQRELGVQSQELGLQEQQRALQSASRNDQQVQAARQAGILLENAKALRGIPIEQRRTYISNLDPSLLGSFGIDQKRIASMQLDDVSLDNAIAQLQSVLQTQNASTVQSSETLYGGRVELQKGRDGSIRYFEYGKEIPQEQVASRLDIARTEFAKEQEQLYGSRRKGALTEEIEAKPVIAGESEKAKLEVQANQLPDIRAAVAKAEQQAKAGGEKLTELQQMQAALPGLQETVSKLKQLAPIATYSLGGRAWDEAAKQLGFGATEGAEARASFIATINNQVLPLLKPTFGGAFTKDEGEALRATMGDPNASPEEKLAQLDAFIENKVQEIETKQREIGGTDKFSGWKIREKGQ